jgi:hypothetical protein
MRKMVWLTIVLAILSASPEASGQTQCDAWIKDFDMRAVAFNSQCIRSGLLRNGNGYCRGEDRVLGSELSRISYQCPRSR